MRRSDVIHHSRRRSQTCHPIPFTNSQKPTVRSDLPASSTYYLTPLQKQIRVLRARVIFVLQTICGYCAMVLHESRYCILGLWCWVLTLLVVAMTTRQWCHAGNSPIQARPWEYNVYFKSFFAAMKGAWLSMIWLPSEASLHIGTLWPSWFWDV